MFVSTISSPPSPSRGEPQSVRKFFLSKFHKRFKINLENRDSVKKLWKGLFVNAGEEKSVNRDQFISVILDQWHFDRISEDELEKAWNRLAEAADADGGKPMTVDQLLGAVMKGALKSDMERVQAIAKKYVSERARPRAGRGRAGGARLARRPSAKVSTSAPKCPLAAVSRWSRSDRPRMRAPPHMMSR